MNDDQFSVLVTQLAASASYLRGDKLKMMLNQHGIREITVKLSRSQKMLITSGKVSRAMIMALKLARPMVPDEF
jgi:hypothetical protein